jgi:hypothetical protein
VLAAGDAVSVVGVFVVALEIAAAGPPGEDGRRAVGGDLRKTLSTEKPLSPIAVSSDSPSRSRTRS